MKAKTWTYPVSAIFAFVLSFSSVGCVITGFALPVKSLFPIAVWCAVLAAVCAVLLRIRFGGILILVLGAAALVLKGQEVLLQARTIAYIVTTHYHRVYGWLFFGDPGAEDVSLPLILWSAIVSAGVNWHICRGKHWLIMFLPTVLPLILCLMTMDKVPDAPYLYWMILCLSVLLITGWTRQYCPDDGMRLLIRTVIPVAVFLGGIFLLNPEASYVNRAADIQKKLVVRLEKLWDSAQEFGAGSAIETGTADKLNLLYVGPKNSLSHSVMRVNSPINGTLYLRGRDYDQYTGSSWEAAADRREVFTTGGKSSGKLSVVTYGVRSVLYVPYYVTETVELAGGAWENNGNYQRYSFYLSESGSRNTDIPSERYLQLPEDTIRWAGDLVEEITAASQSEHEKILRIQDFVRSSASYDLSTLRMDPAYTDFALWFLEESETGYCVHFATSAAVLLRAAGIPARYVEGYMISCQAGEDALITSRDAHAWTEYYDSEYGIWRVLEATPSDQSNSGLPVTETLPDQTREETAPEPSIRENGPLESDTGGNGESQNTDDPIGTSQGKDNGKKPSKIPLWIKTLCKYLIVVLCIPLQAYARAYRKRVLWNRGRPNIRTLERWHQTRTLAKLLKQPYPEELNALAQKARFSQHRLRPEELRQFEDYRGILTESICRLPWYQKMLMKWVHAVF